MKLMLEYNSHQGFDRYASEFDVLCHRMKEAGRPISDDQKKTMFLVGIKDRRYESVVTVCEGDEMLDYQKTVAKIRATSVRINGLGTRKVTRHVNATKKVRNRGFVKRNGPGRSKRKFNNLSNQSGLDRSASSGARSSDGKYGLSPVAWDALTKDQRQLYVEARDQVKKKGKGNQAYGKQYSKANNLSQSQEEKEKDYIVDVPKTDKRPSGNIWRSTPPTRMASMVRRVMRATEEEEESSDGSIKEDEVVWLTQEEINYKKRARSPSTGSASDSRRVKREKKTTKRNRKKFVQMIKPLRVEVRRLRKKGIKLKVRKLIHLRFAK
jgi:hypothetical protein